MSLNLKVYQVLIILASLAPLQNVYKKKSYKTPSFFTPLQAL